MAGYASGERDGYDRHAAEEAVADRKAELEAEVTMRPFRACLTMIFVLPVLAGAACQSTPASNCAGFEKNNLSPAGTVALIQTDRPGYERVIGNDRNGSRRGCW